MLGRYAFRAFLLQTLREFQQSLSLGHDQAQGQRQAQGQDQAQGQGCN